MFSDEKGYLVTEMVWEEMTDDEIDIPVSSQSQPLVVSNKRSNTNDSQPDDEVPIVKKEKKTNNNDNKSKNAKASSVTGQKSMTSFFAKK